MGTDCTLRRTTRASGSPTSLSGCVRANSRRSSRGGTLAQPVGSRRRLAQVRVTEELDQSGAVRAEIVLGAMQAERVDDRHVTEAAADERRRIARGQPLAVDDLQMAVGVSPARQQAQRVAPPPHRDAAAVGVGAQAQPERDLGRRLHQVRVVLVDRQIEAEVLGARRKDVQRVGERRRGQHRARAEHRLGERHERGMQLQTHEH